MHTCWSPPSFSFLFLYSFSFVPSCIWGLGVPISTNQFITQPWAWWDKLLSHQHKSCAINSISEKQLLIMSFKRLTEAHWVLKWPSWFPITTCTKAFGCSLLLSPDSCGSTQEERVEATVGCPSAAPGWTPHLHVHVTHRHTHRHPPWSRLPEATLSPLQQLVINSDELLRSILYTDQEKQ